MRYRTIKRGEGDSLNSISALVPQKQELEFREGGGRGRRGKFGGGRAGRGGVETGGG